MVRLFMQSGERLGVGKMESGLAQWDEAGMPVFCSASAHVRDLAASASGGTPGAGRFAGSGLENGGYLIPERWDPMPGTPAKALAVLHHTALAGEGQRGLFEGGSDTQVGI